MSYAVRVYLRVGVIIGIVLVGFIGLKDPFRRFEARAAAWFLRHLGAGNVGPVFGPDVAVFPTHQQAFVAVVTPSCSSLAAMLAVVTLGSVAPHRDRTRKFTALAIAGAVVVAGNVLRIAAALAVGLVAGRASLVLFHDWIGGLFTFVYILGAYILFLFLLLPRERPAPLPRRVAV